MDWSHFNSILVWYVSSLRPTTGWIPHWYRANLETSRWFPWHACAAYWSFVDDIFQRILVLFLMICLFGFTLNIAQAFETTWIQVIAFYVSTHLLLSSLQHLSGELYEKVPLLGWWHGLLDACMRNQADQISKFEVLIIPAEHWKTLTSSSFLPFSRFNEAWSARATK